MGYDVDTEEMDTVGKLFAFLFVCGVAFVSVFAVIIAFIFQLFIDIGKRIARLIS